MSRLLVLEESLYGHCGRRRNLCSFTHGSQQLPTCFYRQTLIDSVPAIVGTREAGPSEDAFEWQERRNVTGFGVRRLAALGDYVST